MGFKYHLEKIHICFFWFVKLRRRRKWYRRAENKFGKDVQHKLDIAGTAVEILVDQAHF